MHSSKSQTLGLSGTQASKCKVEVEVEVDGHNGDVLPHDHQSPY